MRIEVLKQIMTLFETESKQVLLVYHPIERKYYVQKLIKKPYTIGIYETLMIHPHSNLARIYAVDEIGEKLSVVEEFINGCTLEYELSASEISEENCIQIMQQLMDVCGHLHKQDPSIIHRDIKPSNILMLQNQIKLIDFEIARKYEVNQCKDTVILGSVGYAAPEQYGFSQSDPRTDIYAIGIVLNELLTNEKPTKIKAKGGYSKIVSTCTHMDPQQRYQSIEMLRQAFDKAIPYRNRSHHMKVISRRCILFYSILITFCFGLISSNSSTSTSTFDVVIYTSIVFFVIAFIRWVAIDAWGIRNIIPCPFTSIGFRIVHACLLWCILSFLSTVALFLLHDLIISMLKAYQLQFQFM